MDEVFHYRKVLALTTSKSAMLSDVLVVQKLVHCYQVFLFWGGVAKSTIVLHNNQSMFAKLSSNSVYFNHLGDVWKKEKN